MRYCLLSVFSALIIALHDILAMPLAPPWDDIRVKHAWNSIPPNWETLGRPPAGTTIDLHIALKPLHENALIDALYEVSEPRSPKQVFSNAPRVSNDLRSLLLRCRYSAHLSREQVAQLVAPHPVTLELIYSWLEIHGVPSSSISTSLDGGWLTLTGVPVHQANKLLGASYQLYRPTGTNDTTILRTIGYTLPAVLHPHVRTVVPTTFFVSPRTLSRTPPVPSIGATAEMAPIVTAISIREDDHEEIVPSTLRSMYRTGTYVPTEMNRNELGIVGFLNQYPSRDDLKTFMTEYRDDAIDSDYRVLQVNGGGNDEGNPDPEPNLNMQYTQAIAYPTPHVFYSIGGKILINKEDNKPDTGDIWVEWLDFMIRAPKVPQTISIPYGSYERDVPLEYAKVVCDLFAVLGARGVTVIFPSGNHGVGKEEDCKLKDGSGRVQFIPEFPASCMCGDSHVNSTPGRSYRLHFAGPFVTTVGGTMGDDPENAAVFSGGGFSNHFPRPSYQENEVLAFLLKHGSEHESYYK